KPKGVMIPNSALVNYICWAAETYVNGRKLNFPLFSSVSFDLTATSIFTPLITGNSIVVYGSDEQQFLIDKVIEDNKVGVVKLTPSHLYLIRDKDLRQSGIKSFIVGGESLESKIAGEISDKFTGDIGIYNEYGPTEATVGCLIHKYDAGKDNYPNVPIGLPIAETQIYILDGKRKPVPTGVTGQLYVSGKGLAAGYLNSPGLTAEKFVANPFRPGERMYKTGDLARWLPEGKIEFLGRKDLQVKIRGYRIELAEIEQQLSRHPNVNEAVVIARDADERSGSEEKQDQYLCAYFVSGIEPMVSELKEYMTGYLPDYMIPQFFVQLEAIPLTSNGKVDRKALPVPGVEKSEKYVAPRDETEKKLVDIWAEVLRVDPGSISIDGSFFELGGQSLKQVFLISQIQKEFDVKVPLAEVFKRQTIRELAEYIKGGVKEEYISIEAVEKREYYPLSSAQKRMYILRQIGAQDTLYNIPFFVTLAWELEKERCERVFHQLLVRHETLRTSFILVDGVPVQKINEPFDVEVEYHDLAAEGVLNSPAGEQVVVGILDRFIRPFDLTRAPLCRAGLIKLENNKYMLMFDIHHIVNDGVSTEILRREFMRLYLEEGGEPLPELRIQYKDYSQWQNSKNVKEAIKMQQEYWLKEFEEEIPVLNIVPDYIRPAVQSSEGGKLGFEIDGPQVKALHELAAKHTATLYMVLVTALNILLAKLSGQDDVVIGTPVAGRTHADLDKIIGMFINTLVLRTRPQGEKTVIQFLEDVKTKTSNAYENQEYQFEDLLDNLDIERDISRNPLFDVLFSWHSMIRSTSAEEALDLPTVKNTYRSSRQVAKFDLSWIGFEGDDKIFFNIDYCTKLFKKETIERFIVYFKNIVSTIIREPHIKLSQIEFMPAEEKKRLLYDFNDTETPSPTGKTIHSLFEEQVDRTPEKIVLDFENNTLTYAQLNEKANQLARLLREKGIKTGSIAAVMAEYCLEVPVGILAILKTGAAYLPVDLQYPDERIHYLLKNSNVELILTHRNRQAIPGYTADYIELDEPGLYTGETENPQYPCQPADLAYVLYTSGSTGRPKGVAVEHKGLVNYVLWAAEIYLQGEKYDFPLYSSLSFDLTVTSLYVPLVTGNKLVIYKQGENENIIARVVREDRVQVIKLTPTHLKLINVLDIQQSGIKKFIVGGEELTTALAAGIHKKFENKVEIYNEYGPTETVVGCMIHKYDPQKDNGESVPIGKPIANTCIYILDRDKKPVPYGVYGEIYIAGRGVARGYLQDAERTGERFDVDPFRDGYRMYRSGDLGRRLADGKIIFDGRIDGQLKIRGYRIELGEIENRLLACEGIEDAVVAAKKGPDGDPYLAAYIILTENSGESEDVAGDAAAEREAVNWRDTLAQTLPAYMLPTYFKILDKIPLTPNGKRDIKALPEPQLTATKKYQPPGTDMEKKMVEIWGDILTVEPQHIGIDDNFFQMGGHSLNATYMVSLVHKELNAVLPLAEIFKKPRIREMAAYLEETSKIEYISIEPAEKKEYYDLSSAQKRLYVLHQMEPRGTGYNMPDIISVGQEPLLKKLTETFTKIIKKHESLRTSFHLFYEQPIQKIHPHVEFKIEHINVSREDTSHREALSTVMKNFVRPFDLSQPPLLRAGLVKTGTRYYLLIDMHHIVSDGISHTVLEEDFAALYKGDTLPPLRIQYKDYSQWQNRERGKQGQEQQEAHWLECFAGEIPVLNLPTDFVRPTVWTYQGTGVQFEIFPNETEALRTIAVDENTTLFIVLLSLFSILLAKLSGQEDIVIGTPVAGRRHADLEKVIGMFVNTLALRNYPRGENTFRQYLREVTERTLADFENQEYQFEDLVEKLSVTRDVARNPLFDIMLSMQNIQNTGNDKPADASPELSPYPGERPGMKKETYRFREATSKFDMTLTVNNPGSNLLFDFTCNRALFKEETIERFIGYYKRLLASVSGDCDIKLSQIIIMAVEEKKQILYEFNDTNAQYPDDKTIHHLFEEQVQKTPGAAALNGSALNATFTYSEFNEKSNSLARELRRRGLKPETVVGIVAERSLEMLVAIYAILKAGGAYLPIDPHYPRERISYILRDSSVTLSLAQEKFKDRTGDFCESLALEDGNLYNGNTENLQKVNNVYDLCYVIYTSGSTGKPKGVMIRHDSLVNRLNWMQNVYPIRPDDRILHKTPFTFDVSVWELFWWSIQGACICLLAPGDEKSPQAIIEAIKKYDITTMHFVPSMLNVFLQYIEILGDTGDIVSLKQVFASGEALGLEQAQRFNRMLFKTNETRLTNLYGPTEATIDVSYFNCSIGLPLEKIPIGKPIANTQLYIV
ncbi:MAG: amino acid adenylation domain-containing protein, partial [bacterium]|nr:amino acid adenylation domain-containing protein [bacterium]